MNRLARVFLTVSFIMGITMSAFAGALPIFTFDELGHGTTPAGASLPSGIAPDPFSGIPTLFYTLPFAVVPGDVLISEPGTTNGVPSDLLRFIANQNTGMVFVFSEQDGDDADPADVGIPQQFQTNFASISEIGAEGNNFADWVPPTGGAPGAAIGTAAAVQYHFVSDVPEPRILSLAAVGCLLLLFAGYRAKRAG